MVACSQFAVAVASSSSNWRLCRSNLELAFLRKSCTKCVFWEIAGSRNVMFFLYKMCLEGETFYLREQTGCGVSFLNTFRSFACFFNSWFRAFKLSKHVYASLLLQKIFDLNGIRGRDILEAAEENKVGAIRYFIRSDVNSVQKRDTQGTSLKDVAWSPWNFGDAMTWYNGMRWPGVVSFHFVVPCFDLKGGMPMILMI